MPLSSLLKSASGTCPFCHQKAGILSREHSQCRRTVQARFGEMVTLAVEAERTHPFNEKSLRLTLAEIAGRSYRDGTTVIQVLEEGLKQGIAQLHAAGTRDIQKAWQECS